MSDHYKLVFRGEVLDGQHPAVVRKRLATAGGFDDAALDKLFSGRPVVVKREADTATAARFQVLFKKAGARLRVLPLEVEDDLVQPAGASAAGDGAGQQPDAAAPGDRSSGNFELLPAGSAILRDDERARWQPRHIDTGGLSLEGARFIVPDSASVGERGRLAATGGPDVSHLSLAELGVDLSSARPEPAHVVEAPALEIAAAGEDLAPRAAPTPAPLHMDELDFDVAPAGADLGQRKPPPAPEAPDTSHLTLT